MLDIKQLRRWSLLTLVIIGFDQFTKYIVSNKFLLHEKLKLIPSVNITLAYNHGAAFGILAESGGWQKWFFIGIACVMSVLILYWIAKLKKHESYEAFALACILGGALGNLIDRIRFGYVIDFIDFYIKSWHWYTFNIADAAICVGATLLLVLSFKR